MDLTKIISTLKSVTDTAESVAGPLASLGVPYAGLVKAGLQVAQNLEARISDGTVVATSTDHDQVKQIIVDLEAKNDILAQQIADS